MSCAEHDFGVHVPAPQRFGPPAPHASPDGHVPQLSVPPQPSGMLPQLKFKLAHVAGTHAHAWSAEQAKPAALQSPQLILPPHPSLPRPQL